MWDKIKEIVSLIFGSRLVVEGTGRTFVKVPVVLFGMRVRVVKA